MAWKSHNLLISSKSVACLVSLYQVNSLEIDNNAVSDLDFRHNARQLDDERAAHTLLSKAQGRWLKVSYGLR
jgi:hypothetical protein